MKRGISYQGFVPLRSEPSRSAEMISQVLFGERFTIHDQKGTWGLIEMDFSMISGWVSMDSIKVEGPGERPENRPESTVRMVIRPFVSVLDTMNHRPLLLPAASVLETREHGKSEADTVRFKEMSDEGWISPDENNRPEEIGKFLLSIPALHGGRCGFGFDAPGLVQMLCRALEILLPHSISAQAGHGSILNFFHEAKEGDLAFFNQGENDFTHVGMILEGGRILHVSDQVRIDPVDQQGIYSHEKGKYTYNLKVLKSVKSVK